LDVSDVDVERIRSLLSHSFDIDDSDSQLNRQRSISAIGLDKDSSHVSIDLGLFLPYRQKILMFLRQQ